MNLEQKTQYFQELTLQLRRAGFTTHLPDENGFIPVEWQGLPLCRMTEDGGVRYRAEDMIGPEAEAAKDRALEIVKATFEYMALLEQAAPLKADGLGGEYRLLSDFNGVVLAGHPTEYGVEFVTWERSYDRKNVGTGHYFDSGPKGYNAAKQDFATRSGLIPENALFTPKKLTDLYRCVTYARSEDGSLSYEADQRLNKLQEQISLLAPDVESRLEQQPPQGPQMGGTS